MEKLTRMLADLPWGLNKGHPTTARALKPKHSNRLGKSSARTAFVKALVREVVGFSPYERRVMELIRNSKDKKARSAYHPLYTETIANFCPSPSELTKKRVSLSSIAASSCLEHRDGTSEG